MSIRYPLLAAAVASVLGVAASQSASAVDIQVKQYGSSAVVTVIERLLYDNCNTDFAEYRDATAANLTAWSAGGGNYRTYTCTIASNSSTTSTSPSIAGHSLEYDERGAGGSWFGTVPVALQLANLPNPPNSGIGYNPSTAANCTNVGPATIIGGTRTVTNAYACTGTATSTVAAAPDVGISDVEPAMFVIGGNIPNGGEAVSSAIAAKLSATGLLQQVFAFGVGSTVAAHVTNLSTNQAIAIASGTYSDWNEIDSTHFAAGSTITVCGRTAGSGTQAGVNAIYMGNPCLSGLPGGSLALTGSLIANSSTGNLLSCIDSHPLGFGWYSVADGPRAGTDNFTTISLDGAAASAATGATGSYNYAVESTINQQKSSTLSALQSAFIGTFMVNFLSDPTGLSTVNAQLPAGPALNALIANYTPTTPYAAGNPVEWGTRGGNTCQPYNLLFP